MYFGFYDNGQALIGPNTGLNLALHHLPTMMREGDIPITAVTANGHITGTIYDQTVNGLILRSITNGAAPILGSDATRNSYTTFDGTNDKLEILTSLSFLNTFWYTVPKGTVLMWFKMNGGNAATQMIFGNMSATNVAGLQILRTNTNKITARGGDGTVRWTYTSTSNVTTTEGWVGLIVSVNGVGATAGRFILMNSAGSIFEDATFNVDAGTQVNSPNNAHIGMRPVNLDLFANMSLSNLIIENFPVSDALIEQFRNYNPQRDTTEFKPIVQWLFDMDNNPFIYNNAAGTVVAANGDVVRVMRGQTIGNFNTTPAHGALRRQFESTSDATSAIYRTNVLNGHAGIEFDGTDDGYSCAVMPTEMFEERAGKNTFFLVGKNDDATFGSHFLSGSNYIVLTGSGYSSGAPFSSPYFIVHTPTVGDQAGAESENPGVDDFKIIVYRRNGTQMDAWNGDKVKFSDTATDRFHVNAMGANFSGLPADWRLDGYVCYLKKYNGVLTDAEVEAEIDALKARFGL